MLELEQIRISEILSGTFGTGELLPQPSQRRVWKLGSVMEDEENWKIRKKEKLCFIAGTRWTIA